MASQVYILSIDGGGLKGLIAIKILQVIEQITGALVSEQFDLFAGTSTGGLISCALAAARKDSGVTHNLDHIENMYLDVGQELFRQGGLTYNEKDAEKFNAILKQTFHKKKISEVYKPVFIPAYDKITKSLVVFKTRSAKQNKQKDVSLVEACRATTALPPVFPPFRMLYNSRELYCVDAGPLLKNPALSALAEVWKHKGYYGNEQLRAEDIVLLSISTGNYRGQKADWSANIKDVMHSQEMDMAYIKAQRLEIPFEEIKYLRVDMNLGGSAFSLTQLLHWIERIRSLSANERFIYEVRSLLMS